MIPEERQATSSADAHVTEGGGDLFAFWPESQ